jgi:hypothetical protein
MNVIIMIMFMFVVFRHVAWNYIELFDFRKENRKI